MLQQTSDRSHRMTATDKRLARLELQLGIVASPEPRCPHCRGEGFGGLTIIRAADPANPDGPTPAHPRTVRGGCPNCGRVSEVVTYVFALAPGDNPNMDPWDYL